MKKTEQGFGFLFLYPFTTDKLRHSAYLCTPSDNPSPKAPAQFVRSNSIFSVSLRGIILHQFFLSLIVGIKK